jgi:hypothetical protein
MPTPTSGTTDLFFYVDGVGFWSQTIPYDLSGVKASDITALVGVMMADTGKWFLKEYMPLRFNPGYARAQLGYKILAKTYKAKERRARTLNADAINPNTWTGETRKAAEAAWPETSAVSGTRSRKVKMKIRMRLPQYVNNSTRNTVVRNTLSKVTAIEAERMARRFFKLMADAASRVTVITTTTRGGKTVSRPTVSQQDQALFGSSSRMTLTAARASSKQGAQRGVA